MARTLTREAFFGAVSENLKHLAEARVAFVPDHRLSGLWKFAAVSQILSGFVRSAPRLLPVDEHGRSTDDNLRAYDIVTKRIPGMRPLRLRVIAYYVDGEPSQQTYGEVKRKIRAWHDRRTDNGRAPNEMFTVGAVVIGSGKPWSDDLKIDSDGLPAEVDYQLLAAPSHFEEKLRYDVTRTLGNRLEGTPIFRALEPEPFESRWKRVETIIDALPLGEFISSETLASKTDTPPEDIENMLVNFQASGRLLIDKDGYVKRCNLGSLSIRRLIAHYKGPWYAQHSRYAAVTWGLGGLLSILVGASKQFLPDFMAGQRWIFIALGVAALVGACFFGLKAFLSSGRE